MDNKVEVYKQIIFDKDSNIYNLEEIKSIIEGLLFTAGEPLSIGDISGIVEISKPSVRSILNEMINDFNNNKRGIQIIEFDDKYQMCTRPEHKDYIKKLLKPQNKQSLSRAAIETISIIAYKQPITRMTIDTIRGVKSDRVIISLLDKKLIKETGRLDTPGRPILYGTTDDFLKYFGLKDLSQMPAINDQPIKNI